MELEIKQIKTLYSTFKIIYQKKVRLDNREVAGMISYGRKLIKIATNGISIENQLQTLEHESLHAILNELKIEIADDKCVDSLACASGKFIEENPEFIKVILEGGEKSAF